MMVCDECGQPTTRASGICAECSKMDSQESRSTRIDWGTCPNCGGISSTDETICASCRTNGIREVGD